jgi:hypothetical protein
MATRKASKKAAKKAPNRTPKKEGPSRPPVQKPKTEWHASFLVAFEQNANILAACRDADVTRSVFYEHLESCPDFAGEVAEAKEKALQSLEETAWLRAKLQSDTLLIFLLKAHKPALYNPTLKLDLSNLSDEELERLARQ